MLVKLYDLNNVELQVNPANVLFVGTAQDKGQLIVNASAVNFIGGIGILVKGSGREVAQKLNAGLVNDSQPIAFLPGDLRPQ